ncbi:TPA: hypothetical protein I7721_17960 [Vibrio vulnificus]|nr:hypothetical protein [Vibrio vulnificus]
MKICNAMIFAIFMSFYAIADVSVIGITINKDTKEDVVSKYEIISENGNVLTLNEKNIPLDDVSSVVVALENDKVKAVLLAIRKNKFDYFYNLLKGKYKLTKKEIPYVGNKYVSFIKDDVIISLDAPHLSFKMDLLYIDREYDKSLKKRQKEKKENEKKQDSEQL